MSHTKGPSFAWLILCLKVAAFSLWYIWVIWIPCAIYLTQLASHSAASTRTWQKKKTKKKQKNKKKAIRTTAQHVRFETLYISQPSDPMQKKNVKSPKFAWSEESDPDGELCKFLIGTQHCPHTHCWSWGVAPEEEANTFSHLRNSK